ncbi:hypothetical protein B5X24_HaOG205626 [Helicoverpa armigera]|uniref:TIL domain-containing protein n=1 Tax=Helicoverpa armigera TaxID=29058 RepID=A0A2W1BT45_HELAM|nr:hypothetical protein B5X24_HaOG205626 [Helicoverpa armigera]
MRSLVVVFFCCVAATVAQDQDTEYLFSGIGLPISQEEGNDCGPNEVYDCVYPCPPLKTCADREEYSCLEEVMFCEFQCVCKPGFYLNKPGGVCVTEKQCSKFKFINKFLINSYLD